MKPVIRPWAPPAFERFYVGYIRREAANPSIKNVVLDIKVYLSIKLRKFQAPNNKLQTISKSQSPMIQTRFGFDSLYIEICLKFEFCNLGFMGTSL
jgi:hypothetical protein